MKDYLQHQYLKLNQTHPIYFYQTRFRTLSFIFCFHNSTVDLIMHFDHRVEGTEKSAGSNSLVHSSLIEMLLLSFFTKLTAFFIDFSKSLKEFHPLID
jgi:hypothetical protein